MHYFCIRLTEVRGIAQLVQSAAVTLQRSPVRARVSLPRFIPATKGGDDCFWDILHIIKFSIELS